MTWKFKAQRVAFALAIVAALAVATGANWYTEGFLSWLGW